MNFGRKDYNNRIIDTDNKIPNDEPVFLLRGQDPYAPKLLLEWAMNLRLSGGNTQLASIAEAHASEMIRWQKVHGTKIPDANYGEMNSNLIEVISNTLKDIDDNKPINLDQLTEWMKKLYDKDDTVMILMPSDLKPSTGVRLEDLTLDHFKFNTEDLIKVRESHIILFYRGNNLYKILKSRI